MADQIWRRIILPNSVQKSLSVRFQTLNQVKKSTLKGVWNKSANRLEC